MRKTKVFRPRRGMHFSDDPSSTRPTAYFVGSAAVTRTKPTVQKRSLVLKTVNSLDVSMSMQPSLQGPVGTIYGTVQVPSTGSGPVTLQSITISPSPALIT